MAQEKDATGNPPGQPPARPEAQRRKPYKPPNLVRWGTLKEMTQAVGASGRNDGGRRPYRRTR